MANWKKVVEALQQTDQLACGGLISSYSGGRCALGQLFFVAGKTHYEIEAESLRNDYHKMFSRLLYRKYGLIVPEIIDIWSINDSVCSIDPFERQEHMVEWAKQQEVDS